MNVSYFIPDRTRVALRLLIKVGTVAFLLVILLVALFLIMGETPPGGLALPSVLLGIGFPNMAILSHFTRPSRLRRPTLIIDEVGITDCLSSGMPATIRWDEIGRVEPRSWCGFQFLALHPQDTKAYIKRRNNPVLRFVLGLNQSVYGSPVGIWQFLCPEPLSPLKRLIESRIALQVSEASVARVNATATDATTPANLLQARR